MRLSELLEQNGITEDDFKPKPLIDRVTALEQELAEIRSYVNSIGKTELQGKGTQEDPFQWAVGVELVPNAFYSYDGQLYVYMSTVTGTATEPPVDGSVWALW